MGTGLSADVAVIGLGLIGAAATRHLAEAGADVVGIGPSEPADWAQHHGVFSSHYDSGRITRILDDRHEWAELARRSIASYPVLAGRTGIRFHRPTGVLHATADRDRIDRTARVGAAAGAESVVARAGDIATAPYLLPEDIPVVAERGGAGHIDPRALLAAQLTAARTAGGRIVSAEVAGWSRSTGRVSCHLEDGRSVFADRVLVAAGAYTGRLLPSLAFRIKTETTILVRFDAAAGTAPGDAPALLYDIDHPSAGEVYVVPPVRYPDGHHYLKMGCNLAGDRYLGAETEMNEWMRSGRVAEHHDVMVEILRSFLPDLPIVDTVMKPCLVTYTAHGLPYVDEVAERVFVAAGGNGSAAKSSDALGGLAARLVLSNQWEDALSPESFRAVTSGRPFPEPPDART